MIVVATLLCDRKRSSWDIAIPHIMKLEIPPEIVYGNVLYYTNIESFDGWGSEDFMITLEEKYKCPTYYDIWSIHSSSWMDEIKYDQDQNRLDHIVIARNMCLAFARNIKADYIFFVDADVIVPPNALRLLVQSGKKLVGGVVPGRGVHKNMKYIFGKKNIVEGDLVQANHGTLGCMLIHKDIFNYLSFRWGNALKSNALLSEDPAYCNDAKELFEEPFWIHTKVICDHWDDPEAPLTQQGVSKF